MYYILVHGSESDETGDFRLEILEPNYDFCLGAREVEVGNAFPGNVYSGSTDGASYDPESDVDYDCGYTGDNGYPGVWYKVVGTGDVIDLTTCVDDDASESQIIVFEGNCRNLECVKGRYLSYCYYYPELSFSSTAGTIYYILVFGRYSDIGDFELAVREGTLDSDEDYYGG